MASPPVDALRRRVIARAKITHFLLDPDHPKGRNREKFFTRFGFLRSDPHVLAYALLDHPNTGRVTGTKSDGRGWLCEVTGPIKTPDGRNPEIVSVWIVRHIGAAQVVTANPA